MAIYRFLQPHVQVRKNSGSDIICWDDEEAIKLAWRMAKVLPLIDVWQGSRFIVRVCVLAEQGAPAILNADPFFTIREGLDASSAGKPLSANPHDPITPQGLRWRAGWWSVDNNAEE